jgi:predicted Zn-dependent peptidase
MGWTGPGIDRLEEAIGLDLLSVILAGGRCSRLVRLLREELRVVLDIGSDFSLQRDSSLFTLSAWLLPSRADEVEALVREQIAHLQYRPVTDEEARRAKRLLCNDFIFTTETPGQLAGLYGYYQTLEDASLSAAYPSILRDLQPSHLLHLARQYLSPERYAITVLQPREQD